MTRSSVERVSSIIEDAGGRVTGRTKLQKIAYILEAAGLGEGFSFSYYHYGPYSEELTSAARDAAVLDLISEREQATSWGGFYSIYETNGRSVRSGESVRSTIAHIGASANSIELELAATALFLAKEGIADPWEETARRKPEKADAGRLAGAKELYKKIQSIEVPDPLPAIL